MRREVDEGGLAAHTPPARLSVRGQRLQTGGPQQQTSLNKAEVFKGFQTGALEGQKWAEETAVTVGGASRNNFSNGDNDTYFKSHSLKAFIVSQPVNHVKKQQQLCKE